VRVTIVNSFFPPWRGGAETCVHNLSSNLWRRGHEVTVICGSPPLSPGVQLENGVKVERLRVIGRLYGTPIMPDLPLALACEKTDMIHANYPSPYIAFLSSVVSGSRKIPSVLTWHNDLPPVTPAARALVLAHDHLVLPLYLPRFSFIIATSEIYAETSLILKARRDRVVVIPNGVDTRRFTPNARSEAVRSELGLGRGKVVLFAGALTRWHRYKGLDVLIEAMAKVNCKIPHTTLLVVGGGELETEYRQLADQLGSASKVVFAGNVPDSILPEYYASSDILVLPSKDRSEGFGLTILEANATGKPAIGTTVGGIPSVIRDGFNGLLVPPNSSDALSGAICRVLGDDDLLKRMGKNGRAFAEQHDWAVVAQQTEDLYKRALST
jgi:glycosyltransferase involved in cell wall biosynthesis